MYATVGLGVCVHIIMYVARQVIKQLNENIIAIVKC